MAILSSNNYSELSSCERDRKPKAFIIWPFLEKKELIFGLPQISKFISRWYNV
jgi:hypothetical protein